MPNSNTFEIACITKIGGIVDVFAAILTKIYAQMGKEKR